MLVYFPDCTYQKSSAMPASPTFFDMYTLKNILRNSSGYLRTDILGIVTFGGLDSCIQLQSTVSEGGESVQPDKKQEQATSDVKERDNIFVVEIEVQGYLREEIQAFFNNGYLIVTAKRPEQEDSAEGFKKAVYIGSDVSQEHIRAAFHGGVLKCMIPKDVKGENKGPTEIEIM